MKVTKGKFEPCDGAIHRKVRKVQIGPTHFRQYCMDGRYLLEYVAEPSQNSGWCRREYESINWGRQLVLRGGQE